MSKKTTLAAAIRLANFANLGKESQAALAAGADTIHFDVLDYYIAPNVTFGSHVCSALRKSGIKADMTVHLMVADPEKYIAPYAKAGVNRLLFHPETVTNVFSVCDKIHDAGMQVGLAFNPDKSFSVAPELLSHLDMMLIMSVFSDADGTAFTNNSLDKIRATRKLIEENNPKIILGVDGDITENNIHDVVDAGANFVAIGSTLFTAGDYSKCIKQLRRAIG